LKTERTKSILFLALHRAGRSPGQRFRFEQYMEYLESRGFSCRLSPVLSAKDDKYFYRPGHWIRKAWILGKGLAKRVAEALFSKKPDIVFVQREAINLGTALPERIWKWRGVPLVFDFDDAIWLANVSEANRAFAWLKNPGKTATLIRMADRVIAGNVYLADYALQFNRAVTIIPTTIDTEEYKPVKKSTVGPVCIGWSGSVTTIPHFRPVVPALKRLKEKYGERVTFRVIGDGTYREPSLGIRGLPWRRETELDDLRAMDIGLMPLPDDEWARGKCGLKGLQYMALGIPAVMSPVGVNTEIIEDGVNGFLAGTEEEWVEKLSRLVEDPALREQLGAAGRKTVVERYSVFSQRERYLEVFCSLVQGE